VLSSRPSSTCRVHNRTGAGQWMGGARTRNRQQPSGVAPRGPSLVIGGSIRTPRPPCSSKLWSAPPAVIQRAHVVWRSRSANGSARHPRPSRRTRSWRTIRRQGSITDRPGDPRRTRSGARHDPAALSAIRPHLTLFGPPQLSATTADPVIAAALAQTSQAGSVASANQPPPDILTTRITATAFGPNSAGVTRSAIVRLGATLPRGYEVLAWRDGV
jgi:hypothetical protein